MPRLILKCPYLKGSRGAALKDVVEYQRGGDQ